MIQTVTSETLAEFNASRMNLPEPKEPEAEEEKVEAKEEEIPDEDPKEEHKEEAKPKKGLALRFKELTTARDTERSAREAAEARARAAEEELSKLKGDKPKAAPIDPDVGPKPDPKEYDDAFKYAEDLAEWSASNAIKERDKAEAKAKEEAKRGEVLKAWNTRLEHAKSTIPDFEATLASSELAVNDIARDTIIESEFGPQLLHFLAENDDEAHKFNAMTVKEQLKYLGRLEARFEKGADKAEDKREEVKEAKEEKEAAKPVKRAPAPIEPIKAANPSHDPVNDPGEFKGSYKEWKAARMAKRA